MALLAAGEPDEIPPTIPRDGKNRPLIIPPGGGKPVAYQRASKLGECIEDAFAINRREQEWVAYGMGRRPELQAMAAAIRTADEPADRIALRDIWYQAKVAGGGEEASMTGTALHLLSERADAGEDLSYLGERLALGVQRYRELIAGFTVHAAEQFVVHDGWQVAGTFDRIVSPRSDMVHPETGVILGPDDRIVLDLKTGKSAKYYGAGYAAQQAVYALGTPYAPDGTRGWTYAPDGTRGWDVFPSRQYALILHAPSLLDGEPGLYWVDLQVGEAVVAEAERVKQVRSMSRKAFTPAQPSTPAELSYAQRLKQEIEDAESEKALEDLWAAHEDEWTAEFNEAARRRMAKGFAS